MKTYYTLAAAAALIGVSRQAFGQLRRRGLFNPRSEAQLMLRSKLEPVYTKEAVLEWYRRFGEYSAAVAGARSHDRKHVLTVRKQHGLEMTKTKRARAVKRVKKV